MGHRVPGIGRVFVGIVLHQILQWHHLVAQVDSVTTLAGPKINMLADGHFYGVAYLFTLLGVWLLWSGAWPLHVRLASDVLIGGILVGWDGFNLLEGIIMRSSVSATSTRACLGARRYPGTWGFLGWGAIMMIGDGAEGRGPRGSREGCRRGIRPAHSLTIERLEETSSAIGQPKRGRIPITRSRVPLCIGPPDWKPVDRSVIAFLVGSLD